MTTLLIDGDTVVYKFALGLERRFDWGAGVTSQYADAAAGREFVDSYLAEIASAFPGASLRIALSDPEANWRYDVLPSYKQNRKDFVRPIIWAELREHIRYAFDTYVKPTLEGDDICGILATSPTIIPGEKIIVGIDKDLKTIPGRHYNPETRAWHEVTEAYADWFHLYQTLTGDAIDNYKGCPYVGPVKAKKILGSPNREVWTVVEAWSRVVEAFEARGLTAAGALQQAQVARICRHTDYDFNSKKVIPWQPPA
jgi:DNA polymerase-1